jgi:ABC-type sugar transport system permease subunit
MLIIVLPLGKVAASFGLIDPFTMSSDVATMLAMIAMMAIWLVFGIVIGITLLFLTVKTQLPEHSLQ